MRVKIPISGFVMIAGRVSTCEQVTSFLQLQMSLLDPRTVKKTLEKGKRKNEWRPPTTFLSCRCSPDFKRNSCAGWGDFVISRLTATASSGTSSDQAGLVQVAIQRYCERQFLHWRARRPDKQGWQVVKKRVRATGSQTVLLTSVLQMQNWGTER